IESYGRGQRPTQANHQKQRFRHGYVTPPRPQRGGDQTAASLNGGLRRSDSEPKKAYSVGARRNGWSRPLLLGAPRPMIFK
ncbi:hypothetical protein, partial [Bacteroides fragilis]|uniref:hypothetical protein n=1 Tax=Bacteroides fragilis TaxID=817 RepID=UPI001E4AEDB4